MARANQRKFDGRVYILYHLTPQKKYARAMKDNLKRNGNLSRVTKEEPGKYAVWYRKGAK